MIATLIYYCSKCNSYFSSPGNCPVCQSDLEAKAAVNAYELGQLIKHLSTPEGITKALNSVKRWLEEP